MKPKLLLRIASGCLLFFALGHSIGHFSRHNVKDEKAQAILKLMMDYKFDMFGQMRSYDENYTGMSLNLIFTLLTLATLLWILSNQTEKGFIASKTLLIPIALCVLSFSVTSFLFFFPVPAITCLISTLSMVAAIFKLNKTQK